VSFVSSSFLKTHFGDIAMKVNGNTQIPNVIVYAALYTIVFGISIWLLIAHSESPTNWQVYVLMIGAVLAGAIQFAIHSWKQKRPA
jgi:uncharacterized membrane protein YoaK (UPF0700 family)